MPPARRARSFLVTRTWKLECVDEVRGTIKLLFSSYWGSLYSGFLGCHRRSHLGVSRQFSGASWCISRACRHPELLGIRCGIDLAGFSVRVVRFRCVCNDSLHGLMLALPRHVWCLFLRVDPRYRSTRSDPWSAAASIFPAVSFAIVARFRKRAAYAAATAPLPDKHCYYDPIASPCGVGVDAEKGAMPALDLHSLAALRIGWFQTS